MSSSNMIQPKSDEELIDIVLQYLYDNGALKRAYIEDILTASNIELSERETYILLNKMRVERLIVMPLPGGTVSRFYYRDYPLHLADDTIWLLKEHKTYLTYFKENQRKKKSVKVNEKWERILKYSTGSIAILSTISTLILTFFSTVDSKERQSLKQDLQQTTLQRDSLKAELYKQKKAADTQATK